MQTELVPPVAGLAAGVVSDEEIIGRVLGGEPGLFELLMRRHNQRVFRTVRAVLRRVDDCEDVMVRWVSRICRSSALPFDLVVEGNESGNWLGVRDDFRNWLICSA